jgi:GLPGLI family protein
MILYSISNAYAQTEQYYGVLHSLTNAYVLDSANMKITYSLTFVADSSKPNEKWNDRKILLVGNSVQHFYSYYARYKDSIVTASENDSGSGIPINFPTGVSPEWNHIYNNYPVGKQTVIDNISNFSVHVFNENLADFPKWNITDDTMTILTYPCYKATCCYHGRNWIVWFTMDIPVNVGPWKLHGLPGLILKANDDKLHYVFECNGIEKLKIHEPILMYWMAYKAASNPTHTGTRDKYMKAQRQFYENYVNSLLASGCNVWIVDDSGKKIEALETPNTRYTDRNISYTMNVNIRDRNRKIPYNPIELE